MKSKQLANVLIKILGLSTCIYTIPNSFFGIFMLFTPILFSPGGATGGASTLQDRLVNQAIASSLSMTARGVIEIGIGIFVIVKSRKISEFLFKNEDE